MHALDVSNTIGRWAAQRARTMVLVPAKDQQAQQQGIVFLGGVLRP
jgi:hypothetical protein